MGKCVCFSTEQNVSEIMGSDTEQRYIPWKFYFAVMCLNHQIID